MILTLLLRLVQKLIYKKKPKKHHVCCHHNNKSRRVHQNHDCLKRTRSSYLLLNKIYKGQLRERGNVGKGWTQSFLRHDEVKEFCWNCSAWWKCSFSEKLKGSITPQTNKRGLHQNSKYDQRQFSQTLRELRMARLGK